jgi:hypothetical protein
MMQQQTIVIRGVPVTFDALEVNGQRFTISGKWLKTACLGAERAEWVEDVDHPEAVHKILRSSPARIDMLRFWQRIPDREAKFRYYHEWRHIAAIPVSTYKHWWEKQVTQKVRNKVRKARKQGVVVSEVPFTDEFVRAVMVIFNQTPVRQGRLFYHYGKDFDTVKREMGQDMKESIFLAAHFQGELIGFIKLYFADRYAMITMILDQMAQRDKAPMNGMIDKAVEICAHRGIPFITYTLWRRGDLGKFQASNGFEKMPVPEYFIPLTWKGRLALRLRLHRGLKPLVPEWATEKCLALRARYYDIKHRQKSA